MIRHLARLLALLLVPVLLVTSGTTAEAATTFGPSVAAKWDVDLSGFAASVSCSTRAYWSADSARGTAGIVSKGTCDASTGTRAPQVDLRYSGFDAASGAACSATVLVVDASSWSQVASLSTGRCRVSVIRWRVYSDGDFPGPFDFNYDESGEVVSDLGDVSSSTSPPPTTGCEGMVVASVGQPKQSATVYTGSRLAVEVPVDFQLLTGNAFVAVFVDDPNYGVYAPYAGTVTKNADGVYRLRTDSSGYTDAETALLMTRVKGVQVIYTGGPNGVPSGTGSEVRSPQRPTALGGVTDPSKCLFYFGEKIGTDGPGPVLTIPYGDLSGGGGGSTGGGGGGTVTEPTDPVDPPDSSGGCGFSVTNPSTWAAAGVCALVGVLRSAVALLRRVVGVLGDVVSAVGRIAGSVVSGIIGGLGGALTSLFVPTPGFFEGQVAQVRGAWSSTPPGVILGTVVALPGQFSAASAASGCQGPTVDVNFGPMGGGPVSPLSTCEPWLARVSHIAYVGMQLTVWVGALLLAFRILGASVGFAAPVGSKGGDGER